MLVGFHQETKGGQGGVPMSLADVETECPVQGGYPDGPYPRSGAVPTRVLIGTYDW